MLVFLAPNGGKHRAFFARVMNSLLNSAQQNRMRAYFEESVISIFYQALHRASKKALDP